MMLVIDTAVEIQKFKNLELPGWAVFYSTNIIDGMNEIMKKYTSKSIDNFMLRTHGNLKALAVDEDSKNDIITDISISDFKSFSKIELMDKDRMQANVFSERKYENHMALAKIGTLIKENGFCVVGGCHVGSNESFAINIALEIGALNVGFNLNEGAIFDSGGFRVPGPIQNPANYDRYINGNLIYNRSIRKPEKVKDIILNSNGFFQIPF